MKRNSDRHLHRIERKRKKIKAFLDLVEGKVGLEENVSKVPVEDHDAALKELRDLRKQTQEVWKNKPRFKLLDNGIKARRLQCEEPLSQYDIQCLLLSSLLRKYHEPYQPFYELDRSQCASKVAIFILDGVDIEFVHKDTRYFTEVLQYESVDDDWVTNLLYIPVSNMKYIKSKSAQESRIRAVKLNDAGLKNLTPVSRTDLLLSLEQMYVEGFPLPDGSDNYRPTKKEYTPVTNESPLFGLDCEMCISTSGKSVVTHVALVNEKLDVLLKTYVKPDEPIRDYLTKWSGVRKEHLDDCKVNLKWVQKQFKRLLPSDAILCGQSLHFDLKALGLMHPYIIDTSVIYSFSGIKCLKPSLKTLSSVFLDEDIQKVEKGHCPSEDAKASLKLVQLKLSKGLEYGDKRYGFKAGVTSKYLPLVSYTKLFDENVKVFYDYLELENESKFVCVMSSFHEKLMSQIMNALSTDKCICLVITNKLCCIRV